MKVGKLKDISCISQKFTLSLVLSDLSQVNALFLLNPFPHKAHYNPNSSSLTNSDSFWFALPFNGNYHSATLSEFNKDGNW